MGIFKEESSKEGVIFYALISFFALFLILSFSSMKIVYGLDSENTLPNDIDTSLINDLNQDTHFSTDNLDYYNESINGSIDEYIQNTNLNETEHLENYNSTINLNNSLDSSINTSFPSGVISNSNSGSHKSDHILTGNIPFSNNSQVSSLVNYGQFKNNFNSDSNSDFNNNNSYAQIDNNLKDNELDKENNLKNENNLRKYNLKKENNMGKISFSLENINPNSFYSIFQDSDSEFNNYYDYYDYINLYINHTTISLSSADFKGTPLLKFNNFIKEISNINFTKIDDDKENLIIHESQTSFKPTLNILFFIKLFMEHHDNGKEHLISF